MDSVAEKASRKLSEGGARFRAAAGTLKKNLKREMSRSHRRARKYAIIARHACRRTVADKPFHVLAAALAGGFVLGKWLNRLRTR